MQKHIKLSLLAFLWAAIPFPSALCKNPAETVNLTDTVRIGLLIQDNKSNAARDGASLAIKKASLESTGKKIVFRLIARSMEGPWGTGSKQAANLIFDEKADALICSSDGRNAHLAEQVATKTQVVFLSVWSGDPTLSQAFVPWFYSCTPNNNSQSEALFKETCLKKHFENIAFISDKGYDSDIAYRSFCMRTDESDRKKPAQLFFDGTISGTAAINEAIKNNRYDCLILSIDPSSAKILLGQFQKLKIATPVYGTLSLLDERNIKEEDFKFYESCTFITSGHWFGPEGIKFREDFYSLFGYKPGATASFAYDGTRILIEAIRKAGSDREKIQTYLSGIKYMGVSGEIRFDDKGNRAGEAILMTIKDGIPVLLNE